jgi:signal transduction histidine kinase
MKEADETSLADENARLHGLLAWYRRRDESVLRLNSRFRATPDLPGILQATAVEIGRALDSACCFITLDAEAGSLPARFEYSAPGAYPLPEKPAALVAPIMLQHELLGTITVEAPPNRTWLEHEVAFVHTIAGGLALLLANDRLSAENQRYQREVGQLRTLAQTTAAESDPLRLVQRLIEQVLHLLDAEQGLVGFVRGEAVVVTQFYRHGRWQPLDLEFRPGEGVAGWVLVHARPYLSQNAPVDPQIKQDFARQVDCRTLLAVPIMSGQRVLGVMELHNRRDRQPFSEEDVGYAQTIAHQIAISLERSHLFEEMERRANALETLLAVSAELNEQLNPTLLIRHLVEHATNLVGATAGLGGLVDGTTIQASGYWQAGDWYELDQASLGLARWVVAHKRPYLTNEYRHDDEASQALIDRFDVRAALCVPVLNVNDEVLGFLEVHNKDDGREPFSWADVGMMESLANAAAVAIGNTYLFKELDSQGRQLRALSAQLVTLLEDERRRIARELHDEAGQLLIGIKLNLRVLARQIPDNLPALRENVEQLRREVNQATARLQLLSRGLRPPTLDELGLQAALERLTADFEQNSGIQVQLETAASSGSAQAVWPGRLPQAVEIACYRIVQESLTNVARHAQAGHVWINLVQAGPHLSLTIRDDGRGFVAAQTPAAGLGLLSMRERANMLGGQFALTSAPGQGTKIEVQIPVLPDNEVLSDE